MTIVAKISWAVFIVLIAAAALVSQVLEVSQPVLRQTQYTTNSGELVSGSLVGQTFVSPVDNLSGVGVMFATYSGRNNTEPVQFHLRRSLDSKEDIRKVVVQPEQLGDNQFYRFEFEPIAVARGQQFFWFVVSPTSTPGNAVTVDLNTQDPYHQGSAYLVAGQGAAAADPAVLARSGKQTVDVVFQLHQTVPLRVAIVRQVVSAGRTFVATWDQQSDVYYRWLALTLPVVGVLLVVALIRQRWYARLAERLGRQRLTVILMIALLAGGLAMRLFYAQSLPLTNDEGNYLYDAWSLTRGVLAGGDGYVKTPLVIGWIWLWQLFFGNTILAGRLSSVVIGALTAVPLYLLCKEVWSSWSVTKTWLVEYGGLYAPKRISDLGWGRRIGLVAAAMWAFFGAPVVFNIYIHTQPLALFFGVSGVMMVVAALRGRVPRGGFHPEVKGAAGLRWFVLAGLLLGLGVISRKSILALGLVPLVFILFEGKTWAKRGQYLVSVGFGFLVVLGLFLGGAYMMYGPMGITEALGLNSAEDGLAQLEPHEVEQVRAYSLGGMTPFFRESMPLILLSLIGLGVVWERLLRAIIRQGEPYRSRAVAVVLDHIVPKIGWITAWLVFAWAWNFFFEYEGEAFFGFGIRELWYAYAFILGLFTILPRERNESVGVVKEEGLVPQSKQPQRARVVGAVSLQQQSAHEERTLYWRRHMSAALLGPAWIGGLVFFYTNWIKFHANYLSEFMPPLVVLAAFGLVAGLQRLREGLVVLERIPPFGVVRNLLAMGFLAVVVWAAVVSNYITFLYEHTGTFSQGAVEEAAAWARENIPLDEPIFTGAASIPYLSGHRTVLDIAHPRWYAYEFTRKDPERLNTFLPPAEEMVQAYRDSEWFLLEGQTGFSFLMEYSEIEGGLERDWQAVKGIENGSNTLTFYRRVR